MPYEDKARGLVIAERPDDLPVKCECCPIARRLIRDPFSRTNRRAVCPASGVVYFSKAGVVLAGIQVAR